ncbi:hypothetical protein C0580_00780 [Candidatus Parcubacteria bacterium]|nr:MAG: hypothetical protein C0580_00780 [Candidatus Parcubacteria bacterium]
MKKLPKLPGQEKRYRLPGTPPPYDKQKSLWSINYGLKGMALGVAVSFGYFYYYEDYYSPKIIAAVTVLGYFVGWAVGNFMYSDKSKE